MSGKKFLNEIDRPKNIDDRVRYGSDVAAQMLRRLGIDYIALNPGASYRGLQDSMVNHLGKPFLVDVHIDPGHGRALTESPAERSFVKTKQLSSR